MSRICKIDIDDSGLPTPTPEIEQERKVAIFDLLEDNSFVLIPREGQTPLPGPFSLALGIRDRRLSIQISDEKCRLITEIVLALGPFRQVVKDYYQICGSYFEAVKTMPPSQIEAIDMARRGIHNEGARILLDRLDGKAETDIDTARRLFTLICVLHFGG
jgi:uncharacterized protein (UPF0262 family)